MSRELPIAFSRLVLFHGEIGTHRERSAGLGEVFAFRTLRELPFVRLAGKIKAAYEGKHVPSHRGWPDQREALRWFVERGRDAIYALDNKPIRVRPCHHQHYYIIDGHHRALALFILGESGLRAKIVS